MDTWDDDQPPPQIVEIGENAGLDEFADEGEEPGAPPVPPLVAAATSEQTGEASRESVEQPMIASTAAVAAPPPAAAIVIAVSTALRRGAVFAHARMSRLFRQPAWCDALSPAEIRTLRGLVAFMAVLAYAGLVIGIWNRAVASERRRALASVEVSPARPSTPPAVPAPIVSSPIPSAPIAAPAVAPPAPAPAPAPAPTPLTAAVTAAPAPPVASVPAPPPTAEPAPPVARRARAEARRSVQPPRPRTPSTPRPPAAAPASPSRTPSLAVDGGRSESGRDWPSATVAAVPAVPAGAVASEARLAADPPASVVTAVDPLAADRSAVTAVLAAYRRSYNTLDAKSASAIWEGVDERALRRAFSSLSHQNVSFERCDVRVPAGDRAVARCDGVLSYVAKFGDSGAQQRRMTWDMDFRRSGDRWMIVSVNTR